MLPCHCRPAVDFAETHSHTVDATACGLTAFSLQGWDPDALADALWRRHRVAGRTVRHPAGVRFSTAPSTTKPTSTAPPTSPASTAHPR